LPGGAIIDVYDRLYDSPIRHILARHEQGAVHMADGYARATGKVGVAMVTSGPGATNTVTGIATAYMDSIPIVVLNKLFYYILLFFPLILNALPIIFSTSDLYLLTC